MSLNSPGRCSWPPSSWLKIINMQLGLWIGCTGESNGGLICESPVHCRPLRPPNMNFNHPPIVTLTHCSRSASTGEIWVNHWSRWVSLCGIKINICTKFHGSGSNNCWANQSGGRTDRGCHHYSVTTGEDKTNGHSELFWLLVSRSCPLNLSTGFQL